MYTFIKICSPWWQHTDTIMPEHTCTTESNVMKMDCCRHSDVFRHITLSSKRELQTQAKVLCRCWITAAWKQRSIGLAVVIETHCEKARQCIVGRERQLKRRVSAACRTCHRRNVTAYWRLLTIRQVETQIKVGVESWTARAGRCGIVIGVITAAAALYLTATASAEQFEVIYLITHAQYPVVTGGLIELYTRHAETEHSRRAVFKLTCKIVLERHIYSK